MNEWVGYHLENFRFEFKPGTRILDVGCGYGKQMEEVAEQGCQVYGLDVDLPSLESCKGRGLTVFKATAEQLPLENACFDGAICQVMISYTQEERVVKEISRVLKPGALFYLFSHGSGYYVRYLLCGRNWKIRLYGLRTLINTLFWILSGTRLPGFIGDTIYQSRRRLAKYYRANRLAIKREIPTRKFLGLPVFICQILQRDFELIGK